MSCFGHNIPRFPVETWEIILSYLPRAGDLYNVSLTCRYLSLVTRNLLYKHLYIDPNHYAIHTLMLLENHPQLRQQVSKLFLLPPIMRNIHPDVQEAAEAVYPQLNLPITPAPEVGLRALLWSPLGMASNTQRSGLPVDACIRPIFNYISRFTNLHSLYITGDCVPASFLQWILPLQSLTTLELRETQIASGLQRMIPCSPLPLRHLTILKCWTKTHTAADNPVAVYLCDALLSNSPHLTSLALDSFVEGAAYNLISDLRNPPALISLNCTGVGLQDHDSVMLSRVFSSLGSLTTLNISRVPRELGPILSPQSLPQLTTITGQIRSIGVFLHGRPPRPLKSITVVDFPTSAAGGLSWECILIAFIEGLHQMNVDLQCLAFNLASWSEELFLCIYQLFPKIVELKMQFILGPGVDEVTFFSGISLMFLKYTSISEFRSVLDFYLA